MSAGLASFFDAMSPFLRGEIGASDVEERLGTSPSGARRLGFYRKLIRSDMEGLFEGLFPAFAVAAERVERGLFVRLVDDYLRAYPCSHWDPSRAGDRFADYLAATPEGRSPYPAWFEELADFYETRRRAATDVAPEGTLDRTVFVRHYSYAVPDYVSATDDHVHGCSVELPLEEPTVVLIYRSHHDLLVHVMTPSLAALLVLAGDDARATFPNVSEEELERARVELASAGVLLEIL
jgi:hypothetical protein